MSKLDKIDPGYTYWQHKEGRDIVKTKPLRNYVLFQPVNTPVSDALFYLMLVLTSVNHIEFGWYKIRKSNFYNYFKPVSKLKEILLKERFGI